MFMQPVFASTAVAADQTSLQRHVTRQTPLRPCSCACIVLGAGLPLVDITKYTLSLPATKLAFVPLADPYHSRTVSHQLACSLPKPS